MLQGVSEDCTRTLISMFISMCCFPVRLVEGPSPREGRLELFRDGQWGIVCDRNFDIAEVNVACHMLGFGYNSFLCFAVMKYRLLNNFNV